MKHIRTFESYRIRKNREEIIKESVLQVNDIYKVKTMVDIPQSLINAYVKKVKDSTGKNLRQFFGDVDIAEEIIKYINLNNLDIEKIPASALMGGPQAQSQVQTEVEGSSEETPVEETPVEETPVEETPAAEETPAETPSEGQSKPEEKEFEEPKAEQTGEETPTQGEEKTAEEGEEKTAEEGEEKTAEEGKEELPA